MVKLIIMVVNFLVADFVKKQVWALLHVDEDVRNIKVTPVKQQLNSVQFFRFQLEVSYLRKFVLKNQNCPFKFKFRT